MPATAQGHGQASADADDMFSPSADLDAEAEDSDREQAFDREALAGFSGLGLAASAPSPKAVDGVSAGESKQKGIQGFEGL